jgi:hypothetical protein
VIPESLNPKVEFFSGVIMVAAPRCHSAGGALPERCQAVRLYALFSAPFPGSCLEHTIECCTARPAAGDFCVKRQPSWDPDVDIEPPPFHVRALQPDLPGYPNDLPAAPFGFYARLRPPSQLPTLFYQLFCAIAVKLSTRVQENIHRQVMAC